MPDWRRPEDYTYTKKLSPVRWAWEFLRRNPEYRDEWQEALRLFREFCSKYGEDEGRARFCYWETTDPSDPGFTIGNSGISDETMKRWGIGGYYNPDQAAPRRLVFIGVPQQPMAYVSWPRFAETDASLPADGTRKVEIGLLPSQVAIRFDVRFPLEYQLESAKELLVRHLDAFKQAGGEVVPRRARRASSKWPLYLRALDGKTAGAKYQEIADVLFGDLGPHVDPRDKVDSLLQQARKMTIPANYRKIL